MANWINLLHSSIDVASHSPQHMCIVTDVSTPPLPLQSVAAFHLWHEGDLYDDWSAAGLATSDDTELQAIADGICQAYDVGLEYIHQVHVFSNSTNMLCLTMDVSHHSGQTCPYPFAKCWCLGSNTTQITLSTSTITSGMDLEDHQLAHILATSTHVEVGSAPVISADFARCGVVTQMLNG
jgi:hypothetical protein